MFVRSIWGPYMYAFNKIQTYTDTYTIHREDKIHRYIHSTQICVYIYVQILCIYYLDVGIY